MTDDAREIVTRALHGDQCPEDPDPGEVCGCDSDHYRRLADIAVSALDDEGLLKIEWEGDRR